MTQNAFALHASRAFAGLAIAGTMFAAAWAGSAIAHADDIDAHWTPDGRQAVYLSDLERDLGTGDDLGDVFAQCAEEDCSDQPGQVGMWLDRDTGDWYLELGEDRTYLVDDDTAAYAGYTN